MTWPTTAASLGRLLSGVRVVDLSRILSGPYCTMVLADLGAEVVKIEPPGGDETRRWGPPFAGDTATYFFGTNRNKHSVELDLTTDRDRGVLRALIEGADVLVHNFTPDVAERLGVRHEDVAAIRPDIVHVSFSGFGAAAPERRGYDLVAQSLTGLMSITGERDGPPVKVGAPVSDLSAALFGTIATVAALYKRRETGEGARVEVSLYDATLALLANQSMNWLLAQEETPRLGSEHPSIAPYGAYRAADGELILAVGSDRQFAALCEVLGLDGERPRFERNADRVAGRDELRVVLERALAAKTRAEWARLLDEAGVPNAAVRTVGEALSAPETTAIRTAPHPSGRDVPQVASPIVLDGERLDPYLAPPPLGWDTERVAGGEP